MNNLKVLLTSEATAACSGLLYGFLITLPQKEVLLSKPLTSLFHATFTGAVYQVGAMMIHNYLPPYLKFVLPMLLIPATIYQIYNKKNLMSSHNE